MATGPAGRAAFWMSLLALVGAVLIGAVLGSNYADFKASSSTSIATLNAQVQQLKVRATPPFCRC